MSKRKRVVKAVQETSSFNGLANKFDANIYGTTKGDLRHRLLLHYLHPYLQQPSLRVLDAGGGTGYMTLEFAQQGHNIHLVDVSDDVLNVARERLQAFPNAVVEQNDVLTITQQYDVVLCHAVLEWLAHPLQYIKHLLSLLPSGGMLSLSFFNQNAKVFNNLLYGNFDYVNEGMPVKNTVRLNPHNAQDPEQILQFIGSLPGVEIIMSAGIRCIHDYMSDKQKISQHYDLLFAAECEYGVKTPYKWLGKYFYVQVKKH
ncbi:MAG: methyltransferase domain-containing protein [Glaciecola sp.]